VLLAVPPAVGVNVAGLSVQVYPTGRNPEHVSAIWPENVAFVCTEIVAVPLPPAGTTIVPVGDVRAKVGDGRLMVYSAVPIGLTEYPGATAIALMTSDVETEIGDL
jgi:hypothetical protein